MKTEEKLECAYRTGLRNDSFTFPLPTEKKINLETLALKLSTKNWFEIKIDDTLNLLNVKMIALNFSFNIYANGKVRCFHNYSIQDMNEFLDYFYRMIVKNCVVDA